MTIKVATGVDLMIAISGEIKAFIAECALERTASTHLSTPSEEQVGDNDIRVVMHLHPALAPFKCAVLPLSKKLSENALKVYDELSKHFMCTFDEAGSIGKRYRRQDEIGTPICLTVDFDTLEDNTVTLRDRDTMEQIRLNINEVVPYVLDKIKL